MARVLVLSSLVARGRIGLGAVKPALEALGHEVIGLPTILLSNHPGHPHTGGEAVSTATLTRMLDALVANGWLHGLGAVLTGYMPSPGHVRFAADMICRIRAQSPSMTVIADPILGDDPKGLYVPEAVASAIREELVPAARYVTPNRFELAWLSGNEVDGFAAATQAARALGVREVLATSIPADHDRLGTLLITDAAAHAAVTRKRAQVPHGTGDLLSGLFAGHLLAGRSVLDALGRTHAGLEWVITASEGADELVLPLAGDGWAVAEPAPLIKV